MKFNLQPLFKILKTLAIPLKLSNYDTLKIAEIILPKLFFSTPLGNINPGVIGVIIALSLANLYIFFIFICLCILILLFSEVINLALLPLTHIPYIGFIFSALCRVLDVFYKFVSSNIGLLALLTCFVLYKSYYFNTHYNQLNNNKELVIINSISLPELPKNNYINPDGTLKENAEFDTLQQTLIDQKIINEEDINVIGNPDELQIVSQLPDHISLEYIHRVCSLNAGLSERHYFGIYQKIVEESKKAKAITEQRVKVLKSMREEKKTGVTNNYLENCNKLSHLNDLALQLQNVSHDVINMSKVENNEDVINSLITHETLNLKKNINDINNNALKNALFERFPLIRLYDYYGLGAFARLIKNIFNLPLTQQISDDKSYANKIIEDSEVPYFLFRRKESENEKSKRILTLYKFIDMLIEYRKKISDKPKESIDIQQVRLNMASSYDKNKDVVYKDYFGSNVAYSPRLYRAHVEMYTPGNTYAFYGAKLQHSVGFKNAFKQIIQIPYALTKTMFYNFSITNDIFNVIF